MYNGLVDAKGGVRDRDCLPDCWGAERFVIVKGNHPRQLCGETAE